MRLTVVGAQRRRVGEKNKFITDEDTVVFPAKALKGNPPRIRQVVRGKHQSYLDLTPKEIVSLLLQIPPDALAQGLVEAAEQTHLYGYRYDLLEFPEVLRQLAAGWLAALKAEALAEGADAG